MKNAGRSFCILLLTLFAIALDMRGGSPGTLRDNFLIASDSSTCYMFTCDGEENWCCGSEEGCLGYCGYICGGPCEDQ
jgi:hypothetical protein